METRLRSRGSPEIGITASELRAFIDGAVVLTDDFAPVDQMLGRP